MRPSNKNKIKQNKTKHWEEEGELKEERGDTREYNREVSMIKVHYIHV
jgi:hypothetical protein